MIHRLFCAATLAVAVCAAVPATAADDPVVATVNGAKILRSAVDEARTRLPSRFKEFPPNVIFELLVNSLVDTSLAAAEARRQGLHNEKRHKKQLLRVEEQILERALLARRIKQGLTEDALRKRYDRLAAEAAGKEEVWARHILVDSEAKAKDIIVELKKGGEFAKLAKAYSIGPSASGGGDLGYFGKGQMVPNFSKAAFALAKGAITDAPIHTQFGWHVIKVEGRRQGGVPPYEKAREDVKTLLSNDIGAAYIKELRAGAKIKINKPDKPVGAAKGGAAQGGAKKK